jgi:hypothetical protein
VVEKITSSTGGVPVGKLTDTPSILPLRSSTSAVPVAELGKTVEVERADVAVIEMSPVGSIKERPEAVPVAVPMEGKVELALADTSAFKPIIGKSTTPEFV